MDIGWTIIQGQKLVWEKPERLSVYMNEEYRKSDVKTCIASNDLLKNIFVIKSPFDIHLSYIDGKLLLNKENSSLSYESFIKEFDNVPDQYTNYPMIQMVTKYVFITDKTCNLTILPPFNNKEYVNYDSNTRVVSGLFNIYDWQRPLSYAIEWFDTSKDLIIKTGQPLFYIMFNSEKLDDSFELKYMETKKLYDLIDKCTIARSSFKSKTRRLLHKNRGERDPNMVSKCPFHKIQFWKK